MTIILRPYDPSCDLESCLAIWRSASQVGHPFMSAEELDENGRLVREKYMPLARNIVAVEGVQVVGFIALVDSFIGGLFVAPCEHRKGIGRALIEYAAADLGELALEVYEANHGAREFYHRMGFVEIGRRDLDDKGLRRPLIKLRRA